MKFQQIYRYWIDLCDRRDGSARDLPLQALKRIHLPTKKSAAQLPYEVVLTAQVMEARDIDHLGAQLRLKYTDETCELLQRPLGICT